MAVRVQAKYPVKKTQQMLSDILNVFVQKAQQPYGHHHGKQALAGFKQGNSAQTKMLGNQDSSGYSWDEGKTSFYMSVTRFG